MDKYELIDSIIVQVDALADQKGVIKCQNIIDIISKLGALRNGLQQGEESKNTGPEGDE